MIKEIKYHYSIANDDKVIKLANEFLNTIGNSENFEVLSYKALSYSNLLEDELAIETYKKIIEHHPNKAEGRLNYALILISIGQYLEARSELNEAYKIHPTNLDIISNQIFIEEQLHNYEKVIELSNLALEIDDKEPSIWLTIGLAYDQLKNYEKAIEFTTKGLELSISDEIFQQIGHNNLGYTYTNMNELEKAKIHLKMAIEIDNTEPFAINNLGLVVAKLGNKEDGLKLINHSIEIDNESSYSFKNRAKVYLMEGKIKEAKKDLIKAKELDYEVEYDNEVNQMLKEIEANL